VRQRISPRDALLGAALTGVVLIGTAAAATGTGGLKGVLNLGRANSVNATTTLDGSSPKTLQLINSGPGPALGLHVENGQPPLTTNSETEVQHLNSALVDGESASDFQQKSDDVRLRTTIQPGSEASFDVGLVTFTFSCSTLGSGFQAKVSLLNNAPPIFGNWFLDDATLDDPQVHVRDGAINSGDTGVISTTTVQLNDESEDVITFVWQDSDEVISATYATQAFVSEGGGENCSLYGTATRAT